MRNLEEENDKLKSDLYKYTNILKLQKKKILNLEEEVERIKSIKGDDTLKSVKNTTQGRHASIVPRLNIDNRNDITVFDAV